MDTNTETRRTVWRHPRGIYEVVEISGMDVFGQPYRYRETRQTPRRDRRGLASSVKPPQVVITPEESAPERKAPVKRRRVSMTAAERAEICRLYTQERFSLSELCIAMHRAPDTIRDVLLTEGVEIRPSGRRKGAEL